MSLVNDQSPVTTLQEFDLYGLPPVQTTVEATYQTEHNPTSTLNSGGNIEFNINTSFHEYIVPRETTLLVKFRIILSKSDKSEVQKSDWSNISVVNNLLNSLWQRVDVSIGDTETVASLQTHGYKSFVENLLGYSDSAKESFLSASGWFTDEIQDTPHVPNSKRAKIIEHQTPKGVKASEDKEVHIGQIVELFGKLNFDLAFQGRVIIGGTKMKFKLIPAPVAFFLMCSDDKIIPRLEFTEVTLFLTRNKASNDIVFAHNKALEITPARYPLCRTDVRTAMIVDGTYNQVLDNVINGQLPRRCFIGLVSNEAFSGSLKKNPFHFQHYDLDYLAVYLNGEQFPRKPFKPDFANNSYTREYVEFYRAANQILSDPHFSISKPHWYKGLTLFGFNFSPDMSDGCGLNGYISEIRHGSMRIEIHFKIALPETITVMIFAEYDNLLMIPQDRNGIIDFH